MTRLKIFFGAAPFAYLSALGVIAVVTVLGLVVFPYATIADVTMLYLIGIAIASLFGRGPSLVASCVTIAVFDLCFVPPRYTFAVADASHLFTFAVMLGAGLVLSTLTVRLRAQKRDAVIRERNTAALLAFTRDIAGAATAHDVAAVTVQHLEGSFPLAASVIVPDRDGALIAVAGVMPDEQVAVRWAFEHGEPAGLNAHVLAVPLDAGDATVGVIAVQARHDPRARGVALPMLEAFARQAALALARLASSQAARDAALRAHTEELRSSLLSAVSHDLRTPLAVITGAATTLRDDADRLTPASKAELLSSIVEDAARLERVLGNLLQLTRVESGLVPDCEWIPVEEMVGAALTRIEDTVSDETIAIDLEDDLMAPVDPVLIEQVLINLLDNAIKHGAPPIELHACRRDDTIEIEVRDHGAGIAGDGARLFEKFVRASSAPGAGLGLAVVRAIVEAHGGTVRVESPADGGARFCIALPAEHLTPRPQLREAVA